MATLHDALCADHERLDALFQDLLNAAEGADQPTLQRIWARFESGLLAHLDAEETHLLPVLEEVAPDTVKEIREEHAQIRKLISELGVTTELHQLRKEVADLLVRSLRDHAAYEDRTLYHRADELMSEQDRDVVRHFLKDEAERRLSEAVTR
ncbi:MAG: hemerythrin domain-containing protein [Myxococcota bacterium]